MNHWGIGLVEHLLIAGTQPPVRPKLDSQPLVAIILGSVAFSIALFTFFGATQRLRESSTLLLRIVGLFAASALFLCVMLVGEQESAQTLVDVAAYTSAVAAALGWVGLLAVFGRAYGRVYYMRERGVVRHMHPFRDIRNLNIGSRRLLQKPTVERKKLTILQCSDLALDAGYSILITGPRSVNKRPLAFDLLREGIEDDETGEYVCCSRHPYLLWRDLKSHISPDSWQEYGHAWRSQFRITDAFSPNLAYDDPIAVDVLKLLCHEQSQEHVSVRKARTVAGIHTVGSSGWYKRERWFRKKKKVQQRRPNRIVYDTLSMLTESAGPERVRDFYLHALSIENLNGMITIVIEPDDVEPIIRQALEDAADVIIVMKQGQEPSTVRSPPRRTETKLATGDG